MDRRHVHYPGFYKSVSKFIGGGLGKGGGAGILIRDRRAKEISAILPDGNAPQEQPTLFQGVVF